MSGWVVGVDGGGTRTRAIVVDAEERELARAEGPAALADPVRPEAAADAVEETVRRALDRAGVPLPCAALWAGLAGVGRETTRAGVEMLLRRRGLARTLKVGTDVEAAAEDAFPGRAGILLVAGTGSIGWGRTAAGRIGRVGGWGSLLGDEGSGYAIGLEALRRVARAEDGRGRDTRLGRAILDELSLGEPADLVAWVAEATKAEVAALVPLVARAARDGDAVAGEILVQAVEELEGHVATLLDTLGPWPEPPVLALGGGLLNPGGPLRRGLETALRDQLVEVVSRELRPEVGAARLALRLHAGA